MSAIFIRPTPPVDVPSNLFELDVGLADELIPSALRDAAVLESRLRFDLNTGAEYGSILEFPQDAQCRKVPFYAAQYSTDVVEVRPWGELEGNALEDGLADSRSGDLMGPTLNLPEMAETMGITANRLNETGLVIVGLITLRNDSTLYLPHHISLIHIGTEPL